MPQNVTVYRWDDPGAPQMLNGKPSEIIDVLTKCLVTGYGSKLPLGWSRPFYDAGVFAAVFRNNTAAGGSGGYCKFFSNTGADANNSVMRLTHSISMSDINSFFRMGNTQAFACGGGVSRWVVIGTPIGFYFTIDSTSPTLKMTGPSNFGCAMYIGDFFSSVPSDAARFIAMASFWNGNYASPSSEDSLYYLRTAGDSSSRSPLKIYDADNFDSFRDYSLFLPYYGNSGGTDNAATRSQPTSIEMLMPIFVWLTNTGNLTAGLDRNGTLLRDSSLSPLIRGVLPGLNYSLKVGYQNTNWPFTKSINGNTHWLLRSFIQGGYTSAGAFINMEVWNDPFGHV